MRREHVKLQRAPTVRELKSALIGTSLAALSKDRLVQIRKGLGALMPEGAARSRTLPVVLADTPVAAALEGIRAIVEDIGASLNAKTSSEMAFSLKDIQSITAMTNDWRLPAVPLNADATALTLDQKLVRCEQWWVLISCMHVPPIELTEDCELEARHFEARLAKKLGVKHLTDNPFEGFVQVLQVAKESGRLSHEELMSIREQAMSAHSIAQAYSSLRSNLMSLAQQCGFPRVMQAVKTR